MVAEKKVIDWELIGIEFRAGIKTVRQIGSDHGISHTAIQKRAKKEDWSRDLEGKVKEKAKALVAKAEVANLVAMETKVTEQVVTNVLAQKVADIDLSNRADLQAGIDVIRGMTFELGELSRPEFRERLEWLGELMDKTYTKDNGSVVQDRLNELYRYIISLQGRFKMAKDMAGAVGVYLPLQRKVLGLDAEKGASEVDQLLLQIKREKDAKSA